MRQIGPKWRMSMPSQTYNFLAITEAQAKMLRTAMTPKMFREPPFKDNDYDDLTSQIDLVLRLFDNKKDKEGFNIKDWDLD
jgi:hypothetical protein